MPVDVALTAFDVCALIAAVGILACRITVLSAPDTDALQRDVMRLLGLAILLLTLSSIGILISRTFELAGSWSGFPGNVGLVLTRTHYGRIWEWRIPAIVVLWSGWTWRVRSRKFVGVAWSLMILAVLAIALTRSATGHPADHGSFKPGVWVDWVHLLSGGVWVGSLFGMSLAVFPKLLRMRSVSLSADIFGRLSTLAGVALAFVLAAGIYTAVQELRAFHDLWTSRYGIILDVKVFIVLVMIAIGAHNRYFKLPRLLRMAGQPESRSPIGKIVGRIVPPAGMTPAAAVRSCARAVVAESLSGLAVIAAASILLHNMTPADMPSHASGMTRNATAPGHPFHDDTARGTRPGLVFYCARTTATTAERAGCGILLDANNISVNSVNHDSTRSCRKPMPDAPPLSVHRLQAIH